MAKYIVKIIFLFACLMFLSNVVRGSLCFKNPYCYCTSLSKTGESKIYCNNVDNDNIQSINQLLANHSQVYSLRLHGKYLTSIPSKLFAQSSIKVFEISSPVNNMPDDALKLIRNLEIVNFNGTNFTDIPKGLNLPLVRIVELTHGSLSRINDTLQNLTSATALLLSNNKLSYISPNAFFTTTSLQNLDLSNNAIKSLDASVFDHMPQLKKLNLANNYLQTVDGLFSKLNPKTLILYGNNLCEVSNAFHQGMYNMKWLDLGKNPKLNLTEDSFNNSMPYLSTLKLNDNEFETLAPTLLHKFTYLQNIFLSNNNLTTLPTEFFEHNKLLKTFVIRNNSIKSFDDLTSNVHHSILLLDISGNQIEVIKQNDLQNFTSMTFLNLSGNPLSKIEAGSFENQHKLLKLDLSYSRLTSLNNTIKNLTNLTYLEIKSSLLGSLTGELEYLNNLEYANFRSNKIISLDEAFRNARNLASLDISGNNLTTLTVNKFFAEDKSAPLKKLWIADNPLSCDCRMLWILEWLKKNDTKLEDEPKCTSPSNLKGQLLKNLNQTNLEQWAEDCPEYCECKCVATMGYASTSLNCSNRQLSSKPEKFPRNVASIDLSDNKLTSFSSFNALDYSNLRILKMDNNELEDVNFTMPAVFSLYLARNNLKRIPFEEWNQANFNQMTLSMNPWVCDCKTWQFRNWLLHHNKSILDLNEVKCGNGEFNNQAIVQLGYNDLCPQDPEHTFFIITAVICASLLLATCLLVCIFRKLIAAILYSCGCSCLKQEERENFLFDAFLLYADEDDDFAIGKIAEGLESDAASFYKLFVPTRQILLTSSPVNINSSIADCCKVIVVLTSNFLRNSQCLQLLKTSMACSIQNSSQRFIFIVKEGLPPEVKLDVILNDLIRKSVILKWEEILFWPKLKYRLPKKIKSVENSEGYERLIQA